MALPKWITPAGNLGVIPELEYYEYTLDAYDASGGTLGYTLVSGRLPLGIQLIPTGRLQGIPVSELGGDTNVEYRFTIRVKNQSTNQISDRTFNITITNVAPPVIIPRDFDFGIFLVGTEVNEQLDAVEFTPGAEHTWRISGGELPPGLTLSSTGVLSGFLRPIPIPGPASQPGWDQTSWNLLNWDFPLGSVSKIFKFKVEVFDGVNYDETNYSITVVPRNALTADSTILTIDSTVLFDTSTEITVDLGPKHNPIITTTQDELVPYRQGAYFSFNIDALDLEGDVLRYELSTKASGAFDEQVLVGESLRYITGKIINGNLSVGAYPRAAISEISSTLQLFSGNIVTVAVDDFISQPTSGANAVVIVSATNTDTIQVLNSSGSNFLNVGNIYQTFNSNSQIRTITTTSNITATSGSFLTQTATGANATIVGTVISGNTAVVVYNSSNVFVVGGGNVSVNGDDTGANVAAISNTIDLGLTLFNIDAENPVVTLDYTSPGLFNGETVKLLDTDIVDGKPVEFWYEATINANTVVRMTSNGKVTANVGDYITQGFSSANAILNSVTETTGTLTVAGAVLNGTLSISGENIDSYLLTLNGTVTANVGDFITQGSANCRITSNVVTSSTVPIAITEGSFISGDTYIYLDGVVVNGVFPLSATSSNITLSSSITVTEGQFITQILTGNANVRVTANITSNVIPVEVYNTGFKYGNSRVSLNSTGTNLYPLSILPFAMSANIGDVITQPSTGATAIIRLTTSERTTVLPVRFTGGQFDFGVGTIQINGVNVEAYPVSSYAEPVPVGFSANIGDYITQSSTGANVIVTGNVSNGLTAKIRFISSQGFEFGVGNLAINGTSYNLYPESMDATADMFMTYVSSDTFYLNGPIEFANISINSVMANVYPTSVVSVGATYNSLATEGERGYDETLFDQDSLSLPSTITINDDTGWINGFLPRSVAFEQSYKFEVIVSKRDYPSYYDTQIYNLTVLGDLYNRIEWISPSVLGSIENGEVSEFSIIAKSTRDKALFYKLTPGSASRLPQGLVLLPSGLISGKVSFKMFMIDQGSITLDNGKTTFDSTFSFNVTAQDLIGSVNSQKTFTINVVQRNLNPYENLYLKALPYKDQRDKFLQIVNDNEVFPIELIYRNDDPYFGIAKDIKFLFKPGLTASTLAEYADAVSDNHFKKRLIFGNIKTAVARDENFNVKYEVVYLEILDENSTDSGEGPADTIDLSGVIDTPYYDKDGNEFYIATPNSFENMDNAIVDNITYANKGALPDWMTSRQENGRVLGFVKAVVLAYTVPDASKLISYRLGKKDYHFNEIDFTVDRYHLENAYSSIFDPETDEFTPSEETTFDRYTSISTAYTDKGTVDYAVNIPFDAINKKSKYYVIDEFGGLDGIESFKDGQTLVFMTQEFLQDQQDVKDYNQGWSNILTTWDGEPWAYNADTTDDDYGSAEVIADLDPPLTNSLNPDITPGLQWDKSTFVPGYNEKLLNPVNVINQRISVWKINIENDIITLTLDREIIFNDRLFVKYGETYSGKNIFFDRIIKEGDLVPTYSILEQKTRTTYTTFDGNGTRFFNNRNEYTIPGEGDKYIKFTKLGVFT